MAGSTLKVRTAGSTDRGQRDYKDSKVSASTIGEAEAAPVATTMTIVIRPCPRGLRNNSKDTCGTDTLTANAKVP